MDKSGKKLLSNFIKHAHSHNRIHEERMMWQQREQELSREDICPGWSERNARRALASPLVRGHLVSDMVPSEERSDSEPSDSDPAQPESDSHSPYYWTKRLMKAEESDPFRWGHGGYKEQYPEEFISSSDEETNDTNSTSEKSKTKKKTKRDRTISPLTKKRKRRRRDKEDTSDSDTDEKLRHKRKKHKKRHKEKYSSSKTLTGKHKSKSKKRGTSEAELEETTT